MMKITATAATPYSAVALTPVLDVETTVDTEVVVDVETAVEAETLTLVDTLVLVTVVVLVLVLVVVDGGATLDSVKATMSPEVVPGQVVTASKLHVPIGHEYVLLPVGRCSD